MTALRLPPLSLYVHIPWCERKCPYCDFNSHPAGNALPERRYVDALLEDLEYDLPLVQGRELHSIFFGGGTPSLLTVAALSDLMDGIRSRVAVETDCEITLEANPGSAEAEKFAGFVAAGVNRLSLGVQSFDDERLAELGRIHSGEQAHAAVAMARTAGIGNLNIDLMHGLPGQSVAGASEDLGSAVALAPEHISWYQLTIERNTAFWRRPPALPDEAVLAAMQTQGETILGGAGYRNYEVSAYAKTGCECVHNLNYWEFGDYLGIGAGAHGKITRETDGEMLRTVKRRQPDAYLAAGKGRHLARREFIPMERRAGDFVLNALRLTDGFDLARFSERTGLTDRAIQSTVAELATRELLTCDAGRVRATALGRRYLDDVVTAFI